MLIFFKGFSGPTQLKEGVGRQAAGGHPTGAQGGVEEWI